MSRRIEDLEPQTRRLAILFMEQAARAGHKLVIVHTLRTYEEQAAIYAQGRTRPGRVVTKAPAGHSWHNFGRAFDVAWRTAAGGVTWDVARARWQAIGEIGRRLDLQWGGDWKRFPDLGHFEFHPSITLAQARAERAARRPAGSAGGGPS